MSELETARDKVSSLEAKLAEAKAGHDQKFPRGRQLTHNTAEAERNSFRAISIIEGDIHWAKRRVEMVEGGLASIELAQAREAEPEVSRLWEIDLGDGAKPSKRQSMLPRCKSGCRTERESWPKFSRQDIAFLWTARAFFMASFPLTDRSCCNGCRKMGCRYGRGERARPG